MSVTFGGVVVVVVGGGIARYFDRVIRSKLTVRLFALEF
jgi:hypothetical protein